MFCYEIMSGIPSAVISSERESFVVSWPPVFLLPPLISITAGLMRGGGGIVERRPGWSGDKHLYGSLAAAVSALFGQF